MAGFLSAMLVDSHCHLDFARPEDRDGVIARARRAGVTTLLTISTKLSEFPAVRAIAESDPDIWCSVGIHPHEAATEEGGDARVPLGGLVRPPQGHRHRRKRPGFPLRP